MRLLYVLTYFIRCSEVQPSPPSMLNTSSESIPNLDNGEHDCLSDAESGRAHQSQSHSESQDWPGFEEAEQCLESRASSVTVISESERHSFASPVNVGRDTPVVKPHPFSFKSSRSRLNSQSDTDPLDPCLHRLAGCHTEGGGGGGSALGFSPQNFEVDIFFDLSSSLVANFQPFWSPRSNLRAYKFHGDHHHSSLEGVALYAHVFFPSPPKHSA